MPRGLSAAHHCAGSLSEYVEFAFLVGFALGRPDSPDTPWLVNFDNGFEFNLLRVGNRPNVRLVRGGVAGYETAGTEVDTDPAAVARNAEIERLLNALEEDLAADRLTIPSGRNALERVKAILDLSPDHEGAMEGLRRIMARYEELTSVALARGELDRAEALLRRMDEVQAGTSAASDLRDQISRAREAQEQEQARGVAATHDSPVLAATPAESPETGSATVGGLIEGRYQVIGSRGEIVRDAMTGLEWQRCSLGQSWNGQTCTGEAAVYRWKQAREAADEMGGWRLPEKNELQTLVYCSSGQPARFKTSDGLCDGEYQRPMIVAEAFPNTPIYNYWSHSSSGILSVAAWVVNFRSGSAWALNKGYRLHVRLVRSEH